MNTLLQVRVKGDVGAGDHLVWWEVDAPAFLMSYLMPVADEHASVRTRLYLGLAQWSMNISRDAPGLKVCDVWLPVKADAVWRRIVFI